MKSRSCSAELIRYNQDTQDHRDGSEASLPPLRRDDSSSPPDNDIVALRKPSEGAVDRAELMGAAHVQQLPSELNVTDHGQGKDNIPSHSIMRPMSHQAWDISITGSSMESTGNELEGPANENDPCAERSPAAELCAGDTTDDPTSRAYNHMAPLPSPLRHVGKYRVKEDSARWSQLPKKTRSNDMSAFSHERRTKVEKRRRAPSGKRRARLHRSRSADSGIMPNRESESDRSDSEYIFYMLRKPCSLSGPVITTEVTSAHVSGPSDAGPLNGDTTAESHSSCDETDTDFSDIEQPHPLDPQRDQIVSLLLQRYIHRTETQQELQDTNSTGNGNDSASKTSGGQPQSKPSGAKQGGGQKRKRNSDSQDDDDSIEDDEADPRRRKMPKGTTEESTEHQSFACPFSKKSPSKHRRCYRYDLKRIRDVKQHLRRCHRKGVYCPVCSHTFDSEDARDAHVRQRNCLEKPGFVVEGLGEVQAQSLSGKCSTKVDVEEQWFRVFDICFPGHPRPKSPYVDRNLSEELQSFRDYASTEGPSILRERMQEFRELNEQDNAFLCRVLSDGLELIAEQWSQGLDSENAPELTTAPAATVPRPSPGSSSAGQIPSPLAPRPARDSRGDPSASTLGNMEHQLLGITSGDKNQYGVGTTEADSSIYDFGAELFDFNMLSTGGPVVTAPGEVDYPMDLWTLRYGTNVELAT